MDLQSILEFLPILLVVWCIVIFNKINGLVERISNLENKINSEKFGDNKISTQIPNINTSSVVSEPLINLNKPIQAGNYPIPEENKFITWLKDDWILKLGGLLLIIGFGWLTTYAFMNNWVSPTERIIFGILVGIVILFIGSWRIKNYINQGGIFLVLGSTIVLLTVFIGNEMYKIFTPITALLIMLLSIIFVSIMSIKYNTFALALSSLFLSAVVPLLTGIYVDDFSLFSYLLVIILGAVWIVSVKRNWGQLIFSSFIILVLYYLPFLLDSSIYQSEKYLIVFAYIFAGIFFISSAINVFKSGKENIKTFLSVSALNGIFLLMWILLFVAKELRSVSIFIWMVIFLIGAFILFKFTKIKEYLYVYAGLSVVMIGTIFAIELDGSSLTIAYILEAGIVPIIIYMATKDFKATAMSSSLLIIPGILSIKNLINYFDSKEIFNQDFFVIFLMTVVLFFVGVIIKNVCLNLGNKSDIGIIFIILGSIYLYIILWRVLHIGIEDSIIATTCSLVIFTIIGLFKYFYGIYVGSNILRNYGAFILGFVVFRLILIDIWQMDMGARIIVLFLVGILLTSTAFIGKKIKTVIVG